MVGAAVLFVLLAVFTARFVTGGRGLLIGRFAAVLAIYILVWLFIAVESPATAGDVARFGAGGASVGLGSGARRARPGGRAHNNDLRHTGNQFTADAGANTKELMVRMGHDSERAALIYLHSSDTRQRALADAVAKAARAELTQSKTATEPGRSGTQVARNRDDLSETQSR